MAKTFDLVVVSPEDLVYQGKVQHIMVKGSEGDLGIYPGHLQLLSQIAPGPVRFVTEDNEEELLYVSGGILEVQPHQVSILADVIERPQDVNETAAIEAKEKAEAMLASKSKDVDERQVNHDLSEAVARLRVLELMRKNKKRH